MTTITSIGIGSMGAALARALLAAPQPPALTLWNRTADRPQIRSLTTITPTTAAATFEPSLPAAIARSTTLLICLLDYPAIMSVFEPLLPEHEQKQEEEEDENQQQRNGQQTPDRPRPLQGKTVINLTNGTPRQARDTARFFLGALGAAAYFDGAVMVTPELVGGPEGAVLVSGETAGRYAALVADVLGPVGAVAYVGSAGGSDGDGEGEGEGDVGAAALYDVAALAGMYGMFMGAFTGFALLKRKKKGMRSASGAGETREKAKPVAEAVMVPLLQALVPYVALLADSVDKEDWMDDTSNPLAMQLAGVRNIMQACEEEGVDGSGMAFLAELMERAVGEGHGPGGLGAIAKYLFK